MNSEKIIVGVCVSHQTLLDFVSTLARRTEKNGVSIKPRKINSMVYHFFLRWLATFEKNVKLFLKQQFSEAKFNADFKSEKKNWVSRTRFRDNQHLMDPYALVFEANIARPEVGRNDFLAKRITAFSAYMNA